jgi:hypothetical protein
MSAPEPEPVPGVLRVARAGLLGDKPLTKSWVARGVAIYFAAKAAEAAGLLHPGSVDQAIYVVQQVDWNAVTDGAQALGIGTIALGIRRVLGEIHLALKNPAI